MVYYFRFIIVFLTVRIEKSFFCICVSRENGWRISFFSFFLCWPTRRINFTIFSLILKIDRSQMIAVLFFLVLNHGDLNYSKSLSYWLQREKTFLPSKHERYFLVLLHFITTIKSFVEEYAQFFIFPNLRGKNADLIG